MGPNSTGKSQFLRDLYERLSGNARALVVAQEVRLRKPDLEPFLACLEKEGLLAKIVDDAGNWQFRPLTTHLGSGQALNQIASNQPGEWYRTYTPEDGTTYRKRSEFLSYFGKLVVTGLFLDRRLTAVNQTGTFDFESGPPQHDLQALYVDDLAKGLLLDEIRQTFGKAVWLDATRGNALCLKVSDDPAQPTLPQRLSAREMARYRTIETEGDGLRSYIAICIALLLGRRPICLIDEPEMCLHPPQAYSLGRFIGRFGSAPETATFVATHSSHVLRGIIQSAPKLQIIRLTRHHGKFGAHLVASETLKDALTRPTVRAETVLDGIFAEAVVVVEADTDRTVYQAVWESMQDEFPFAIHFAAVGGTGGIADTCRLYKTLQIPIAIIADLDIVTSQDRMKKVLSLIGGTREKDLLTKSMDIAKRIKEIPPTVAPSDVRAGLEEALKSGMDWASDDDSPLRSRLNEIVQALDRMRRLKRGGLQGMPDKLREPLAELVLDLRGIGLFVVPVGELEEWLGGHGLLASKTNKWAWANEAAAFVRASATQTGDIWEFMRSIGHFLRP